MICIVFNSEAPGVAGLALRVSVAVTWLTVYRQLHIPVKITRPADADENIHDGASFDRDVLRLSLLV